MLASPIAVMIAGLDDIDDTYTRGQIINGPEDFDDIIGAALQSQSPHMLMSSLASAKVGPKIGKTVFGKAVTKLKHIGRQMLVQTGRIEADYLRRPNTLCSIYATNQAAGASVAFSVTPGVGNSFYRILGFICSDDQANIFGFSQLKVGGQDHVQFSQTTPTAPVANAVPWSIFQLKEGRLIVNLAPWTGQVFDQSSPVTGTIVNMTVAAGADAVTVAPRCVLLSQTDPCGYRYTQLTEQSKGWWKTLHKNIGAYHPLMLD